MKEAREGRAAWIIGSTDLFLWGPWASSKAEAFDEISACWDEEGRDLRHGPFNARLANSLSVYSGSLNAKLRIVMQPVGTRPPFVPEEPEHPIALGKVRNIPTHRLRTGHLTASQSSELTPRRFPADINCARESHSAGASAHRRCVGHVSYGSSARGGVSVSRKSLIKRTRFVPNGIACR
jgi:Uncharacterized protein conserved in bacteria (DUF2199)